MRKPILALTAAWGLAASISSAATVLIDFGPTGASNITTGLPETWNNFNGSAAASSLLLVDTTNAATGITVTLANAVTLLNDDPAPAAPTTPPAPFTPYSVTRDGIFNTSANTLTLSGLNPALTYNISLYSYVNRNTTRGTNFTIGSETQTIEPARLGAATSGATATFTNLTPTPTGQIVISVASNVGNNWILNGMSVTYVPEPSAFLLSAAGACLFGLRRRRAAGN